MNPEVSSLLNLGEACLSSEPPDPAAAREHFAKAIESDPEAPQPRIALGALLLSMGHLTQAIKELKDALDRRPRGDEAQARLHLAAAYEKCAQMHKAREQWKKVVRLIPTDPAKDEAMQEARRKLRMYR